MGRRTGGSPNFAVLGLVQGDWQVNSRVLESAKCEVAFGTLWDTVAQIQAWLMEIWTETCGLMVVQF